MLKEALSYPLQAEHRLKTIGIGGLLYIVGTLSYWYSFMYSGFIMISLTLVAYIVAFVLAGYSLQVLRLSAHKEETLPEFSNWTRLCINGLKMALIALVYMFIPKLLEFVEETSSTTNGNGMISTNFVLSWTVFGLSLVAGYFLLVGLTNFALTDRLQEAFEFRTIVNAAMSSSYVLATVIIIVLGTLLRAIAEMLIFVVIGFFILFYVQIFLTYLAGYGCGSHLLEMEDKQATAD